MLRKALIPAAFALSSVAQAQDPDSIYLYKRERRETVSVLLLTGGILTTAGLYVSQPKSALPFIAPAAMVSTSIVVRIPIGRKKKPRNPKALTQP